MTERLERGWHELNGIKYYGSHPLPDMLHDALREPGKFNRTSYCQICMREVSRCVCAKEGLADIKERLNHILTSDLWSLFQGVRGRDLFGGVRWVPWTPANKMVFSFNLVKQLVALGRKQEMTGYDRWLVFLSCQCINYMSSGYRGDFGFQYTATMASIYALRKV